ncbi:MAG: enoyl-CoA hydratase-related protein [Dehalococcoidia bacterium]
MYGDIAYAIDGPVATIKLNRPDKLNATTPRMMAELRHALADAERNGTVAGIVLTGAGRGFCAGADMAGLQEIQREGRIGAEGAEGLEPADPGDKAMGADFARGLTYLVTVRKPIIAAINGPCAGYGFSLVMFCDLRFASESALFTTAFAQRGLVAEHGMSWVLPRLLGSARALDILWSGRKFDANEALQLGVVSRVVPDDTLMDTATGYILELAARCSPRSIMHMKQQIYQHMQLPLGEAMRATEALMAESVTWPDFKEGIASFMERRPPQFPPLEVAD